MNSFAHTILSAAPSVIMMGVLFAALVLILDYLKRRAHIVVKAPRSQRYAALILTLVALMVRLALSPCAPYHGEGTAYLFLSDPCNEWISGDPMRLYGHGGFVLYQLAVRIIPGGEQAIFMVNLVLGSLSTLLLYLFTLALLRSSLEAFAAGLLFALFPSLIRINCSESFFVPLVFWWLVALNVAVRLKASSHWRDWALLVCALYMGVNTRPAGGVVLVGVFVLLFPILRERPRRLWWALPVAVGCINPAYMLLATLDVYHLAENEPLLPMLLRGATLDANINPWVVPQVWPILAHPLVQLSGLLILLFKRRFHVALMLFSFQYGLLWTYSALGITTALYNGLRFFSSTVPVACIFSGIFVGAVVRAIPATHGAKRVLAVPLIVLGTLAPYASQYMGLITFAPNLEQEYRVLQRGALSLPPRGGIIIPAQPDPQYHNYASTFPRCLLKGLGKNYLVDEFGSPNWIEYWAANQGKSSPPDKAETNTFVFIGLNCFVLPRSHPDYADAYPKTPGHSEDLNWTQSYSTQEWVNILGDSLIHGTRDDYLGPHCAQLFEEFDLVEHHVEIVQSRPAQWFAMARDELTIGFYRATPRGAK